MTLADEHLFAFGPCWSCGRGFVFHPDLVPSVPVDPQTNLPPDLGGDPARAVAQPVCRRCVDLANRNRARDGRPLIVVLPGAYPDEAP